jgi:predicted RND superfamily exporter protein
MAGFASLMVAHHQGIFGLGLLLTVGMTTSLFASVIVLPVLLRIFYGAAAPNEGHIDPVSRAEPAALQLTEP